MGPPFSSAHQQAVQGETRTPAQGAERAREASGMGALRTAAAGCGHAGRCSRSRTTVCAPERVVGSSPHALSNAVAEGKANKGWSSRGGWGEVLGREWERRRLALAGMGGSMCAAGLTCERLGDDGPRLGCSVVCEARSLRAKQQGQAHGRVKAQRGAAQRTADTGLPDVNCDLHPAAKGESSPGFIKPSCSAAGNNVLHIAARPASPEWPPAARPCPRQSRRCRHRRRSQAAAPAAAAQIQSRSRSGTLPRSLPRRVGLGLAGCALPGAASRAGLHGGLPAACTLGCGCSRALSVPQQRQTWAGSLPCPGCPLAAPRK